MADRRRDPWILVALLPLVGLVLAGRARLAVDVENLAMKSVGTAAGSADELRAQAFGNTPTVLVLAEPVAAGDGPTEGPGLQAWIDGLRDLPQVAGVESAPVPDGRGRCMALEVRADASGRYAEEVQGLLEHIRSAPPAGHTVTITGYPVVELAIARTVESERNRVMPALVAALVLVLSVVLRRPSLVVATLAAPLLTVLALEALQGFAGLPVDPVSALLGPAVLAVGVASAVHVVEAYGRLRDERGKDGAAARAVAELRLPLALTVATTVTGFMGLSASPIPAVQRFGWLASLGVALAVGGCALLLPTLLRVLDRSDRPLPGRGHGRAGARRAAPPALLGLCLGLGLGLFGLDPRVDSDPIHVLDASDPVRLDAEHVASRVGGDAAVDLLLPPPGPEGGFAALRLAASLYGLPGVAGPAGRPESGAGGVQRIPLLLAPATVVDRSATFDAVEARARDAGWPDAAAAGLAVRMARDSDALVAGQRRGLLWTCLGLFTVMAIGFRSIALAALGLLPNVLPIAVIQGSMGVVGRPLTVATSMIGTVMLGLIVDNTIHLLHAYRSADGTPQARVGAALAHVRRPILLTTVVLAAGFGATLLGELGATREFGVTAVVTLLVALAADLWILPALLTLRTGA